MTEIGKEERAYLTTRIDDALARGGFGPWETRFLQDMRRRLGRARPRLNEKQSRKLHDVLSRSHSPYRRGPQRLRRGGYQLGRNRSFDWRRPVAFLLVVAVTFCFHQLYLTLSAAPYFTSGGSAPVAATSTPTLTGRELPGGSAPATATSSPNRSGSELAGAIRVIDGDTVEVGGEHVRLVGLNTPETFEPRCAAELALGTRAKERLEQLLASGTARLEKVACACPPGTEGTKKCNYGRSCGVLSVNDEDVARILISEGLAAEFHCGTTSCPPMPRPWCG